MWEIGTSVSWNKQKNAMNHSISFSVFASAFNIILRWKICDFQCTRSLPVISAHCWTNFRNVPQPDKNCQENCPISTHLFVKRHALTLPQYPITSYSNISSSSIAKGFIVKSFVTSQLFTTGQVWKLSEANSMEVLHTPYFVY